MNFHHRFAPACLEVLESRIVPAVVAAIALGGLDGTDGFKLSGVASSDYAGHSVSDAGDVNGDGFADLLVGAFGSAEVVGGDQRGATYVVFGKAGGFGANVALSALNGSNGFKLGGVDDSGQAGKSVSAAGDVNGDGFADLLIGAPKADGSGAAYVVFGRADFSATGGSIVLSALDGGNGFKLSGAVSDDFAGTSVSGAGDVNGDGFADLLVGAPYATEGGTDRGAAYVVFGQADFSATSGNIALSALDGSNGFKLSGVANGDRAGRSVSAAGDVNGDGFADLLVGADGVDEGSPSANRGAAYVVFGKADFSATSGSIALSALNGSNGFKLSGVADGDRAGRSVSGAGDVNGDGFADLLIGAPYARDGVDDKGAAYVVFGKAGGFGASVALSVLDGSNGFKLSGAADGDEAGKSVSAAGDVNGDGFADLLIGAEYVQEAYVVFGKAGGFGASVALSALDGSNGFKLSGVDGNDAGRLVSAAGDVNGDGFDDLIVGAPDAEGGVGIYSGAAYVVFGFGTGEATVSADGKTATYTDVDGDKVTLKSSKGGLTVERLHLSTPNALGGSRLVAADFSDPIFVGSNITLSAKPVPRAGGLGDGLAHVGSIFGGANGLGAVKLDGDLGQLDAGAVKTLTVHSLGLFPVAEKGAPGTSAVTSLGALTVKTGWSGVDLAVAGTLGKVAVGGAVRDVALTAGTVGAVKIGGDLSDAEWRVRGVLNPDAKVAVALRSLTLGGTLSESDILLGYDAAGAAVNPDVQAGAVKVKGSWIASNFIAGATVGTDGLFGTAGSGAIAGGNATIAKIASITVGGLAFGTAGGIDHFGIVAQQIGALKIGKAKALLSKTGLDVFELPLTGDFTVREVA